MRLVASAYINKHKQAFAGKTPPGLYLLLECQSILERHDRFYNYVREQVWTRITFKDDLPPSVEALQRHWLRTIWVVEYWEQSCHNDIIDYFGWSVNENSLVVNWDSDKNVMAIRKRVTFLTKGCGCRTGCTSKKCKCVRDEIPCGPGCLCKNCKNPKNGNN